MQYQREPSNRSSPETSTAATNRAFVDNTLANFIRVGDSALEPIGILGMRPCPNFRKIFSEVLAGMYRGIQAVRSVQSLGPHASLFDGIVLPEQKVAAAKPEHQKVVDQWQRILALVNPDLNKAQSSEHKIKQGLIATRKALADAIHDAFKHKSSCTPAGPIALGMIDILITYAEEHAINYVNAAPDGASRKRGAFKEGDCYDFNAENDLIAMRQAINLLITVFKPVDSNGKEVFARAAWHLGPQSTASRIAPIEK